ncbi:hypothetical protein HU200_060425 [Digitaria exilis]|uniref:Uncharacterized protein n=1 Tax=Digitaria exilis TaxID=1010633 RepID=A0A835A9A3_9POAL|nr:hypothetical protein HU200_060425 [Digitaria exilis]
MDSGGTPPPPARRAPRGRGGQSGGATRRGRFQYTSTARRRTPRWRWSGARRRRHLRRCGSTWCRASTSSPTGLGIYSCFRPPHRLPLIHPLVVDPELMDTLAARRGAGAASSTRGSDEFKPFHQAPPEFKFWSDPLCLLPDLSTHLARSTL